MFLIVWFFACGGLFAQSQPPPRFPLVVESENGDTLILEAPPKRIVALDSGAVEILFALGAGQRVVATHRFVSYPPEVEQIEKVGDSFRLDFEKIASLEPDLIYIFFARYVPDLKRLRFPVLYLQHPKTLKAVSERMLLWGKIVNKSAAAETLVRDFQQKIDRVRKKLSTIEKGPRIFHYVAPELWTMGSGTLTHEIYTLLKAENVFADLSGAQQVGPEAIIARNPEVIISFSRHGLEFLRSHPALRQLEAVRTGKVFSVERATLSIAGPRLPEAIERVARILYPELFP